MEITMRMVRSIISFMFVAALLLGTFVNTNKAAALGAYTANWTSIVSYHNVGAAEANLTISFYSDGSGTATVADHALAALPVNAGRTLLVADVSGVTTGFKGGAVINSDQPVTSAVIQYSPDNGFKVRMLYTGFDVASASDQVVVASVLKAKFDRTTVFSIQNTETVDVSVTVNVYDAEAAGALVASPSYTIPAQSVKYVDMGTLALTGGKTSLSGSAIVVATKNGSEPALVVVAGNEYYSNSRTLAASFEGVPLSQAATTIYMATALCNNSSLQTAYAITNASTTQSATVNVVYKRTTGADITDGPYTIGPGQKKSVRTCLKAPSGFTGAATITSTGAGIVVLGKAEGMSTSATQFTAFLGEAAGSTMLSAPYVRWGDETTFNNTNHSGSEQRTFLAIQNISGVVAPTIRVRYFDKDGVLKGTQTFTNVANGAKVTSNPSAANALTSGEFGYYADGSSGGAAIIDFGDTPPAGGQLIAIVRANHAKATYSEDYNAQDIVAQ